MARGLLVLCGTSVPLALLIIACEDFNSNNKIQALFKRGDELPMVRAAVIDGLAQGEEVISDGHYGMADNTMVQVLREQ